MNEKIKFEGLDRRIDSIEECLKKNRIENLSDAKKICEEKNINTEKIIKSIQPIAFDNAFGHILWDVQLL